MKLYNTVSRSMEPFVPREPGKVKMYTCGPTVYNFAHIGNLRTYISEDVLEKTLVHLGYAVQRCMNITDVGHLESDADDGEDKMLKGAKRERKTVWEIAAFYAEAFFEDCQKLNVKKPEMVIKATDCIEDYIEFIKVLEEKGFTYFENGNVYFDISKFPRYTQLSKMTLEDLRVAHREDVEADLHKRNPQDFVLWFTRSKFDNQAMKWDSPWGVGYPGWHIECSVISLKALGEQLDIHCGGVDHIAVHHTNEIAQTESYTGKPWTKYWWHAEFLTEDKGKMSKSSGEFLTVSLLEDKGFSPLSYRYYVLNSHYRKQLAFSFENLEMAQTAYYKLRARTSALFETTLDADPSASGASEMSSVRMAEGAALSAEGKAFLDAFSEALADDLNTANAMTQVYALLKSDVVGIAEKRDLIQRMDAVLSLDLTVPLPKAESVVSEGMAGWIQAQIDLRSEAKRAKDWARADAIRDALKKEGVTLIDTPGGVQWKLEEQS